MVLFLLFRIFIKPFLDMIRLLREATDVLIRNTTGREQYQSIQELVYKTKSPKKKRPPKPTEERALDKVEIS